MKVIGDTINVKLAGITVAITPTLLYFVSNPESTEVVYTEKLKYPVKTSAMTEYSNNLGVKFQRLQNVYYENEKYFIDVFNELFEIPDVTQYDVKPSFGGQDFTINGLLIDRNKFKRLHSS